MLGVNVNVTCPGDLSRRLVQATCPGDFLMFFFCFSSNGKHVLETVDREQASIRDSTGCPKKFGQRCQCRNQQDGREKPARWKYFVTCNGTLFTSTEPLQYLPLEVEVKNEILNWFLGRKVEF